MPFIYINTCAPTHPYENEFLTLWLGIFYCYLNLYNKQENFMYIEGFIKGYDC